MEPRTSFDAGRFQLYAEPQYLRPPFGAVNNRYRPNPINQLPKIWRYSQWSTSVSSRWAIANDIYADRLLSSRIDDSRLSEWPCLELVI